MGICQPDSVLGIKRLVRMNTREIGNRGEEKAAGWLLSEGFNIIDRNFRKRGFEIDIIAVDVKNVLRFIEVKTVEHGEMPDAFLSVENRNIARYFAAADVFICENPKYAGLEMGMDVLVVHGDKITRYENVTSGLVL